MRRWITWLWVLQFLSLLGVGGFWYLAPQAALRQILPGVEAPVAVAATRMLAPFILGMALFTALGVMSAERMLRRQFAGIFALFLLPWMGVVAYNMRSRQGVMAAPEASSLGFYATGGTFLLIAVASFFSHSKPDGTTTGYRTTAPAALWPFWAAQAGLLVAFAAGLLVAPGWVVRHILLRPAQSFPVDDQLVTLVTVGQLRLFPPYLLGAAFFTVYGLGRTGWIEIWTFMARIFSVIFGLLSLAALISYQPDTYSPTLLVAAVVAAGFSLQNLALARTVRQDGLHDMGRPPKGWTALDLPAGPLMALQTLMTKRRASHLIGIGARGRFEARPDPRVPANEFFEAGRVFPAQMRFANLTMRDDAALDVRGASLKLSLEPIESPFDMVFNTGSFCPARNVVEFAQFVLSKFMPTFVSASVIKSNQRVREGGIAGLRRAPASFLALCYHSQIVRGWTDEQRRSYLVRYRLVGEGPESGLPDEEDCAHIWLRGRRLGEPRPPTYLRQELATRLERRGGEPPATLRLQAQFHPYTRSGSLDWYNAGVEWDEEVKPWLDVGVITLEEALPDRATEQLFFNPWNQPESLFTPRAVDGLYDYRSLGDAEARVMHRLQKMRRVLYGLLGLPRFDRGSTP